MASTAQQEQAFLDGTHPALQRGTATAKRTTSVSPARSTDSARSRSVSPRQGSPSANRAEISPSMRATSKWTGAVNTGPKGVLADYEATFAAGPTKQASKGSKGVLTDWRNNEEGRGRVPGTKQHGAENGDEEEPERDDFVDEWRRRRIEELSNSQDKKRYGQLREINEETFLAAIEDPSDAWVVLHLYEPDVPACQLLNRCLANVARAYPYTKFVRTLATEVEFATDNEHETLPTLLIYRHGELEHTLVRADQEMGRVSEQALVGLLSKLNVITGSPAIAAAPFTRSGAGHSSASEEDD